MASLRQALRYYTTQIFLRSPPAVQKRVLSWLYAPYVKQHAPDGTAPLFKELYLELRTRCNSRVCTFCPAVKGMDDRPDLTMPFDLYEKIIDELAELGYSQRIAFYISNEPLIVRDFPRYVALARRKLPRSWLMITTNGLALSPKTGAALLDAGLSMINLNIYNDDLTAPLPQRIVRFEQEVLYKRFPRERVLTGSRPPEDQRDQVFVYNVNRRRATQVLTNRGGVAPNKRSIRGPVRLGMCDMPFESMSITADGRVGRCCADHYIHHPMGNVRDNTVSEIWNGPTFCALRRNLLHNNRPAGDVCGVCDVAGVRWTREHSWRERILKNVAEALS